MSNSLIRPMLSPLLPLLLILLTFPIVSRLLTVGIASERRMTLESLRHLALGNIRFRTLPPHFT